MRTTIEYSSKLAIGDEIIFYLDGEKFTGKVVRIGGYWIDCSGDGNSHHEVVNKVFSHFGISDKYDFRNRVIGYDIENNCDIWPRTNSLEELRKMLDEL